MTQDGARITANVVLAAAAAAIAFVVFRNPRLRRAIGRVIWTGVTSALPGLLAAETRNAWNASGHRA